MTRRNRLLPSVPSLRSLSSILLRPQKQKSEKEAAVLAIIDQHKRILICKRADNLNSYPGEEIGIDRELIAVQYELAPYSSMAGVSIHPVVGTVDDEPQMSINLDEVAETMWVPLESFLKNDCHWHMMYGNVDIHGFDFPQFKVYGLTAHFCTLIAIIEFGRAPEFELTNVLTTERMANMTPSQIVKAFYERNRENVRAEKRRKAAKL